MRRRNGIGAGSKVEILAAEANLYVAKIDDKIITKIGAEMDLGNLIPPDFKVAADGNDYAVWEKQAWQFFAMKLITWLMQVSSLDLYVNKWISKYMNLEIYILLVYSFFSLQAIIWYYLRAKKTLRKLRNT